MPKLSGSRTLEAERGELVDGAQARHDVQEEEEVWLNIKVGNFWSAADLDNRALHPC
jgi:hypothetical protein